MDRNNFKKSMLYKCITQKIPVPYGSLLHIPPTNLLLPAAKQEPCQKQAYPSTKNIATFSGEKKSGEWASKQKKNKPERVKGLGKKTKTREEIVKWNQMTAIHGRGVGDIRHPRPPFCGYNGMKNVTKKSIQIRRDIQ